MFLSPIYVYPEGEPTKHWFIRFNPPAKSFHLEGPASKGISIEPVLFFFRTDADSPLKIKLPADIKERMLRGEDVVDLCAPLLLEAAEANEPNSRAESRAEGSRAEGSRAEGSGSRAEGVAEPKGSG